MEEHFLKEFVSGVSRETPKPWYNSDGDCIIYQMADEAVVADRIDSILTIYRSAITNKPIGYQVKDVQALMRRFGWDGIRVEHIADKEEIKGVSMYILLLAAYEQGPQTIRRREGYAHAIESFASRARAAEDEAAKVEA